MRVFTRERPANEGRGTVARPVCNQRACGVCSLRLCGDAAIAAAAVPMVWEGTYTPGNVGQWEVTVDSSNLFAPSPSGCSSSSSSRGSGSCSTGAGSCAMLQALIYDIDDTDTDDSSSALMQQHRWSDASSVANANVATFKSSTTTSRGIRFAVRCVKLAD